MSDGDGDALLERPGHEALWLWFGLSRASWLTMPRVLMHAMPDHWQRRMAQLLSEYDAAFTNRPELGTRVQITTLSGRLTAAPPWISNYRHPDNEAIDAMRAPTVRKGREHAPVTLAQMPACECKCHRRGGEQRHRVEVCCERAGETFYDEEGFPLA